MIADIPVRVDGPIVLNWTFLWVLLALLVLPTVGWSLLSWLVSGWRRRTPEASDDACAACGATDLLVDGPGLYTCRACGYQGGSRRGQADAAARRAQWASRPAAERVAAAAAEGDLATARHLLTSLANDARARFWAGIADGYGRVPRYYYLRVPRSRSYREMQLAVENLFAEVFAALRAAAEKVPEIEVPPTPKLSTGPGGLRQKEAEIQDRVAWCAEAVDRAGTILALVPRTDPPSPAAAR